MTVIVRTLLCAMAAALALGLAPGKASAATSTIVIGDSITCMGQPYLAPIRPNWRVDCVAGREVNTLKRRIAANLATYGTPTNMVLALGQNESAGWTEDDYRAAVRMIPKSVKVYFITTYRDPRFFGAERAAIQKQYSSWMTEIASTNSRVYVIRWRKAVIDGIVVLPDGSHPDAAGARYWAQLVASRVG